MAFLHPILFAAGLSAVAIPILIHLLLRRKRRPVKWAAMRFLLEAHRRRQRRRKLEQILLLLARCLLIATLAAAIARPLFGRNEQVGASTLVLVLDNSLTASIVDESGRSALDRHRAVALEQLERLSATRGDRFALIAAAGPARSLVSPATLDLDAARRQIEAVRPTDSAIDLPGALAAASGAIPRDDENARVLLVSEWRRGAWFDGYAAIASTVDFGATEIVLSPGAEDEPANLRITSFAPGRGAVFPGDTASAAQALVTIEREGETLPESQATLNLESIGEAADQTPGEERRIALPRGERVVTVPVALPLRASSGGRETDAGFRVSIRADGSIDRIARDSVAWRTVRLRDAARVGVVHARRANRSLGRYDAADWARVALRPDPLTPVEIRELNAAGLIEADLSGLDAAVLTRPDLLGDEAWVALERFVRRGATLVVFPPAGQAVHRWPDGLRAAFSIETEYAREASAIDPPASLTPGGYRDAFPMLSGELEALAASVSVSALLSVEIADERVVLRAEDGGPFLFSPRPRLWVFASALDTAWTDLPAKPLLLPLMQEMARQSVAPARPTTVFAGEPPVVAPGVIELIRRGTGQRLVRSPGTGTIPPSGDAGLWSARNARGESLGLIAVTPDHRAGRTGPTPIEDVAEALRRISPGIEPTVLGPGDAGDEGDAPAPDGGRDWIPFLVAAGLALLEVVAARLASHAGGVAGPAQPAEPGVGSA